jgi:hypothetical protein
MQGGNRQTQRMQGDGQRQIHVVCREASRADTEHTGRQAEAGTEDAGRQAEAKTYRVSC